MSLALRHPAQLPRALLLRWPNAVEATVGLQVAFVGGPRLPYQIAESARRGVRFLLRRPWAL